MYRLEAKLELDGEKYRVTIDDDGEIIAWHDSCGSNYDVRDLVPFPPDDDDPDRREPDAVDGHDLSE